MNRIIAWGAGFLLLVGTACAQLLVVDPGHGGPGANKTNNGSGFNGGNGANGPLHQTSEQWVNLRVALILASRLEFEQKRYYLTRVSDTDNISLQTRVFIANRDTARGFLSIHHNGLGYNTQATEVVWCDTTHTDASTNSESRDADAYDGVFPKKILYSILDTFKYSNRCSTLNQPKPIDGCQNCTGIYVVRNTKMANVISEASNLNNVAEEQLYLDIWDAHAQVEADALLKGWKSFLAKQGFGRVEYKYAGQGDDDYPPVGVDFKEWSVPYERTWPSPSTHTLEAENFTMGGYFYTFHHWEEQSYTTGNLIQRHGNGFNPINVETPMTTDGYHYYVA